MNKQTRRALILFGIWSIPVAFQLFANEHRRVVPIFNAFIMQAVPWYYWALVTLPVIRHAARRSVPRTMRAVLGYQRFALLEPSGRQQLGEVDAAERGVAEVTHAIGEGAHPLQHGLHVGVDILPVDDQRG